jgi:hypothetical protein
MGRIAKLLSFFRTERNGAKISEAQVDPGGGANITAQHFANPGDDSQPLPGDFVALATSSGTGRENAVGYLDPLSERKALKGEKRIYARDANGAPVAEVWLKNTGDVEVANADATFTLSIGGSLKGQNGAGFFELTPSGDFLINGVIIDSSGNITSPANISGVAISGTTVAGSSSVTVAGSSIGGHIHAAGNPPGNTGPMV